MELIEEELTVAKVNDKVQELIYMLDLIDPVFATSAPSFGASLARISGLGARRVITVATIGIVRLPQSRADDGTDRQNLAGTLHVSLPTDIIQLFGTGSVPAIFADGGSRIRLNISPWPGKIYGCLEFAWSKTC